MKKLPDDFLNRMKLMLGMQYDAFIAEYDKTPKRGLRVNTLKIGVKDFVDKTPFDIIPSKILNEGFVLDGEYESIGTHPYHVAGLYYVQEPSAMSAASMLDVHSNMKILDLCAAPGGKTGAIAAHMGGSGLLVSNEIVKNRAKVLIGTIERLGAVNTVVTNAHPDAFATALPEYFDTVFVDAPCSGEGMFRKDDTAVAEWSMEHVAACATRQNAILESAVKTLKCGGTLIYSTCTFSKEENEDIIAKLLERHKEFELIDMKRYYPHTSCGEGHFAAKLVKNGGGEQCFKELRFKALNDSAYNTFIKDTFAKKPVGDAYILKDGRVIILRTDIPEPLKDIHILCAGVAAGEIKNGRFEPFHSFFMAEHGGTYARKLSFLPDDPRLLSFLYGNTIEAGSIAKGYVAVSVEEHNVGFGKVSDGVVKNHIPKGLRMK